MCKTFVVWPIPNLTKSYAHKSSRTKSKLVLRHSMWKIKIQPKRSWTKRVADSTLRAFTKRLIVIQRDVWNLDIAGFIIFRLVSAYTQHKSSIINLRHSHKPFSLNSLLSSQITQVNKFISFPDEREIAMAETLMVHFFHYENKANYGNSH